MKDDKQFNHATTRFHFISSAVTNNKAPISQPDRVKNLLNCIIKIQLAKILYYYYKNWTVSLALLCAATKTIPTQTTDSFLHTARIKSIWFTLLLLLLLLLLWWEAIQLSFYRWRLTMALASTFLGNRIKIIQYSRICIRPDNKIIYKLLDRFTIDSRNWCDGSNQQTTKEGEHMQRPQKDVPALN